MLSSFRPPALRIWYACRCVEEEEDARAWLGASGAADDGIAGAQGGRGDAGGRSRGGRGTGGPPSSLSALDDVPGGRRATYVADVGLVAVVAPARAPGDEDGPVRAVRRLGRRRLGRRGMRVRGVRGVRAAGWEKDGAFVSSFSFPPPSLQSGPPGSRREEAPRWPGGSRRGSTLGRGKGGGEGVDQRWLIHHRPPSGGGSAPARRRPPPCSSRSQGREGGEAWVRAGWSDPPAAAGRTGGGGGGGGPAAGCCRARPGGGPRRPARGRRRRPPGPARPGTG